MTSNTTPFSDRRAAGRLLVRRLLAFRGPDVVVLGVPRGGIEVACEIATQLRVPLDVLVVEKLCAPGKSGSVVGAITEHCVYISDHEAVRGGFRGGAELARVEREVREELHRRTERFRSHCGRAGLAGRTVVIVDDAVRTGATARAAARTAYRGGAVRVVVAAPVIARRTAQCLADYVDNVVSLREPADLTEAGEWYQHPARTTDAEVCDLLQDTAVTPAAERN